MKKTDSHDVSLVPIVKQANGFANKRVHAFTASSTDPMVEKRILPHWRDDEGRISKEEFAELLEELIVGGWSILITEPTVEKVSALEYQATQ